MTLSDLAAAASGGILGLCAVAILWVVIWGKGGY